MFFKVKLPKFRPLKPQKCLNGENSPNLFTLFQVSNKKCDDRFEFFFSGGENLPIWIEFISSAEGRTSYLGPSVDNLLRKLKQILSPPLVTEQANVLCGVARWFNFIPKIKIWANFDGSCNRRCWYILWTLGPFYGPLLYFMDILYNSCYVVWYIFSRFGILFREKSGNPGSCNLKMAPNLQSSPSPLPSLHLPEMHLRSGGQSDLVLQPTSLHL
jgi:hypothetical protein